MGSITPTEDKATSMGDTKGPRTKGFINHESKGLAIIINLVDAVNFLLLLLFFFFFFFFFFLPQPPLPAHQSATIANSLVAS
ncbi:uncharacterized protein PpBr36_06511 [Pyricularia pennisetigena]|uniref:uncharacterized protein n=1 Tax=Pyricularia pennisetigena TaxID=1578925 RepID=UPI001153DFDE|nr:uncharacterized protein PpBr36_06511 [Pyricularia pennisetigena]TLS22815.1 hypothetical protein PpBr36_06511 [Pyricularia pennisetigena]